jgi:crossover junction endodeoxyribonuclease RuvC
VRVLGVDPGSIKSGYGIVDDDGDRLLYISSGEIPVDSRGSSFSYTRLKVVYDKLTEVINTYSPDVIAIEDIFYSKNIKSTIKLGYCRGAIILAALNLKLDIYEYTPLQIKKAIVGYGRATKDQVEKMVKVLLNNTIPDNIRWDASDSLAVAICHINSSKINTLYDCSA